jgi:hypothetical protein
MTVQQERPLTVTEHITTVRLPAPRIADHDAASHTPLLDEPLRGWGSAHDRRMAQWLMVMAVCLGLYCSVFLVLGARVFG